MLLLLIGGYFLCFLGVRRFPAQAKAFSLTCPKCQNLLSTRFLTATGHCENCSENLIKDHPIPSLQPLLPTEHRKTKEKNRETDWPMSLNDFANTKEKPTCNHCGTAFPPISHENYNRQFTNISGHCPGCGALLIHDHPIHSTSPELPRYKSSESPLRWPLSHKEFTAKRTPPRKEIWGIVPFFMILLLSGLFGYPGTGITVSFSYLIGFCILGKKRIRQLGMQCPQCNETLYEKYQKLALGSGHCCQCGALLIHDHPIRTKRLELARLSGDPSVN
ncbi:hypothetical protein N9B94_02900 [Verrucomicrobia bacterium]|nr:hypothetical protein [Verrucomicrobiota bacterium]